VASDDDDDDATGNADLDDGPSVTPDVVTVHITNPVVDGCADPGVMQDGATYYLTCTGGGGGNHFPIYSSTDLSTWTHVGFIFPHGDTGMPSWARGNGAWWAPELHHSNNGIVALYAANLGANDVAVGTAFASTAAPTAGYVDVRGKALEHGDTPNIDPTMLVSLQGERYLFWKIQGANGHPASIWAQPMTADGLHVTGKATKMIEADRPWERNDTEGPSVRWIEGSDGGYYYLFYSGGEYCDSSYAVGVARSKRPLGPYVKHGPPILASGTKWVGPGHNALAKGPDGKFYIIYHAYQLAKGKPSCDVHQAMRNTTRDTRIDRLEIGTDMWPKVVGADL
jgi:beta-xylosidase